MRRWRVLASVTTTVMTEVEAKDPKTAMALAYQRQIQRVHGDGKIDEVWVVPDGRIERTGLEIDMEARELDMDCDDESVPVCPRCGAGVVGARLDPRKAIVVCGHRKTLLSRNGATGLLQVATPDEVDAAEEGSA